MKVLYEGVVSITRLFSVPSYPHPFSPYSLVNIIYKDCYILVYITLYNTYPEMSDISIIE